MATGPLTGVRVVELAGIGPGPYACLLLAELGADVIRVDRPGGSGLGVTDGLNRSRPCVAIDLKTPEGLRPGVTERLGVGPDACLSRNPRIVYGRMTGWGQDGPMAQMAGHDINYAAITGALHAIGPKERPLQAVNLVADFGGGAMFLVVGVLAALLERGSSGRGQVVDAAMVDGAASLATMIYTMLGTGHWVDRRQSNLLDGGAPFYDTYECQDGRFVAVGALEPQFYAALVKGLGVTLEGGQMDVAQWPSHRAFFAAAFLTRTRDEWASHFAGTDACVAPVLGMTEAPQHPHMVARGTFASVDGIVQPNVAPRFSRTPTGPPTPPRKAGQDNETALRAWGFTEDEIKLLGS